ncbi:hypothetical protein Dsin_006444 [Dipteronia sinensis]|uniref:Uncharacterized protein n=1 Tax=Dipteronia sinensis TaxID=43782 RepID=A0AAE0EG54_9ROSI|nr:hypothetical protein Dsin_006444 [Dipteronia sinensis]
MDELQNVLHMNEGEGDNSYAKNSGQQKQAILKAKPFLQESIVELYNNTFPEDCMRFADMGCSSGPNALTPAWEAADALYKVARKHNHKPPALQVFLNDLPGNDFNTVFKSLPSFFEKLKKLGKDHHDHDQDVESVLSCFIAAVPGSYYCRLFPPSFLHFVFSSYSLHWLSQVSEGLISESGVPLNKKNIYPTKTSPQGFHKAYFEQFEKDFTKFLKLRTEELVPGGRMVLIIGGNQSKEDSIKNYRPMLLELIGMELEAMVSEGIVEEWKLDTFNVPLYAPSLEEIQHVIEREGSYNINLLEKFELSWDAGSVDINDDNSLDTRVKLVLKIIRSVTEPILASHFGNSIMDDLFKRLSIRAKDSMEKGLGILTNMLISLTKK